MRQAIRPWVPAAFCAFLSLLALSMQIGSDSDAWKPTFYSNLTMCFIFVGFVISNMEREIRELRQRLTDLEKGKSN